ncbi:hypothetical protein A1O3_07673 [Capronia epimyces CBS 606.96]|uniref:Major facilitator superfamily (MFS) profile domain-containing protein n=1 Tax=Capronia epimyces CBS 606.96 TaxID=1182542 RepID=W9XLK1_9EURO|nr:uncharacterized protein A1O3_07673 [Capronia epimyces CBS 606.96]EXJ81382.1 hypothetical protein A1O3_07673 [Capronia epimyces CBS 606.96]
MEEKEAGHAVPEETSPKVPVEVNPVPGKSGYQPPEGGTRAWLVVLGSTLALFSTLGYVNSFGVYQEYYSTHQLRDRSASSIAWIGSIQVFFQFSSGVVAGPLFDRHGEKIMWFPCVTYTFAIMMTSLCKEYYQFILAQGILSGISSGLIFTVAVSVPNHYFRRNIGAAVGIIVAGSSLGGVIFPITLNQLLNLSTIGFGWSVRICGFINVGLLSLSCLTIKAAARNMGRKPDPASFKRPVFYLTTIASFFLVWGMFVPYFYLPVYSIQRGMSADLASYLIAIMNAASLFGRVLPGMAADRLGRYNLWLVACFSSGILLLCWGATKSNAAILVFAILFGFFSGAIISLMNACVAQITPDPRQIGAHIGVLSFICGFAGLSGSPISGAIATEYNSYVDSGYFGGASMILGAFIVVAARLGPKERKLKVF